MKRIALIVGPILGAGAIIFALLEGMPRVREVIETNRHAAVASRREPVAHARWKAEFGEPTEILAELPSQEDSEAALRLIEIVDSTGIDLRRPGLVRRPLPESTMSRALRRAIADYGRSELIRTGGSIQLPPDAVRSFLDEHRSRIEKIVGFLSTSEVPEWKSDISLGYGTPIPNLLGLMHLQNLLVAEILYRAQRGEESNAERVLNASWSLNASLRDRSEVISQIIAISVARFHVGLARRLSIDPTRWRARFLEHDYRKSLLRAMQVEFAVGLRNLPDGGSRWDRASRADFMDITRSFWVSLRDSPIFDEPKKFDEAVDTRRSGGAVIAAMPLPNLANAVSRADRLILDTELTDRVLELRMQKAALGRWPSALPGNLAVSRVPGGRWIYSVGGDRRMIIHFSRELAWQNQKGLNLPTRYESH